MKAGESHLIIGSEGKKRLGRPPNGTKARRTTIPVDQLAQMRSELASSQRIMSAQEQEIAKQAKQIDYLSKTLEEERNKPVASADPYAEWAKRSVPELIDLLRASGF